MKSATERRLLFALLLSSLVPLVALGVLSVVVVGRMGREVRTQNTAAHLARLATTQSMKCLEVAERVSVFLWRRQADARALTLLTRDLDHYRAFSRTSLAPLWADDADGEKTRIWAPLYSEVGFLDLGGHRLFGTAPASGGPGRTTPPVLAAPDPSGEGPDEVRVTPLVSSEGTGTAGAFSGVLRFTLPVRGPEGDPEGVVSLDLDPRHLEQRIFGSEVPATDKGRFVGGSLRWAFFFGQDGTPLFVPVPGNSPRADRVPFVAEHLPEVLARIRDRLPGAVGPDEKPSDACLAYAPLLFDAGPYSSPQTIGGILLYSDASLGGTAPLPGAPAGLTRGSQLKIVLLTLASSLGVILAALLVARRMAQPWTRLRDKASAVVEGSAAPASRDEVDLISKSFDSLASQVAVSAGLLRASEERLREFLEMNPDGIAVTDADGRLIHFNRGLCQMLRRTPAQLAAMKSSDTYARPEDRLQLLKRLRQKGRLTNYEVELARGDGTTFPALLSLRLTRNEDGECIDSVIRDISELVEVQRKDREKTEALFRVYGELSRAHQDLRRAYTDVEDQVRRKTAELRNAYEALQTADRVKTEFLMKMSHELRTPLNCIIGYSEAMSDGLDGPVSRDQARSLERIAQSGRRLLRMIENLLDLSRLEAGHMEFLCTETVVEEAVEDVLHQTRSLVGGRPVRMEISLEEPLPRIWADPDRLRQVLFNLVGNALKFTQEGRVAIEARRQNSRWVEIRVADTGPGIPPDHLESIFDKFVQVPGSNRVGAGLGLAICRELMQHMGGMIRAESTLGEGSAFVITLPVVDRHGQLSLPLGGDTSPAHADPPGLPRRES